MNHARHGVLEHLKSQDPIISRIIDRVGPCLLRPSEDYFDSLARTIISQQLSAAAAEKIYFKLALELGGKMIASKVTSLSDAQFVKAGISKQKRSYLVDLADKFVNNEINVELFVDPDDEKIINYLESLRGIGRWSAEMFLIFCLGRPNILPLDDVGFKRAVRISYNLRKSPSVQTLKRLSKQWVPYRSIAVWYLWQSIDGIG